MDLLLPPSIARDPKAQQTATLFYNHNHEEPRSSGVPTFLNGLRHVDVNLDAK